MMSRQRKNCIAALSLFGLAVLLSGCAMNGSTSTTSTPNVLPAKLSGSVHGGRQPIAGAAVGLYIASVKAYGDPIVSILKTPVFTDATGGFTLSGDYSCQPGDQLYIASMGGNPGAGNNPNAALMAALGECTVVMQLPYISVNEVTTVASVFALAPFMTSATAVGTTGSNIQGLVHAFASVHKLVNTGTGTAPGDMLPAGAVAPTGIVNTLANVIAGCINSKGDTGSGSHCNTLFARVTPANGTLPTDTIGAALLMAKNPTLNVSDIFDGIAPISPFGGMPSKAPTDWTLAVTYTVGGFNQPSSTTVDQAGNIWVANAGNNTVSMLSQAGNASVPLSANGLAAPVAIAIDRSGNAWVANASGTEVSAFTLAGTPLPGSPFGPAGINQPVSLAFDASGDLWVVNSGSNSVLELSPQGATMQQISGLSNPTAVAIDPK